jgi:hypothetical protein
MALAVMCQRSNITLSRDNMRSNLNNVLEMASALNFEFCPLSFLYKPPLVESKAGVYFFIEHSREVLVSAVCSIFYGIIEVE